MVKSPVWTEWKIKVPKFYYFLIVWVIYSILTKIKKLCVNKKKFVFNLTSLTELIDLKQEMKNSLSFISENILLVSFHGFFAQSKFFEHFERFSPKSIWIISSYVSILHPEAKSIAPSIENQLRNNESKMKMGASWVKWAWKGGDSSSSKQIVKRFGSKRNLNLSQATRERNC